MIPLSAIPKFQNRVITHNDIADNADIRRRIIKSVPEAVQQAKSFAHYFKRGTDKETCRAIFDYLKNDLQYRADGSEQIIKLPSALLRTRVGDCKSFSLLTSAILTNLDIPHHFVLTSYNNDPTPSHIYVQTNDGCIIDAVWGIFDDEKKATHKYWVSPNGKLMKVISMAGVSGKKMGSCGCGCGVGATASPCNTRVKRREEFKYAFPGIGKTKAEREAAQELRKLKRQLRQDVRQAEREARKGMTAAEKKELREKNKDGREGRNTFLAVQPMFIAGRAVVLTWLRWNLDGMASAFSKFNWTKMEDLWHKVGGNSYDLSEAIRVGSQKPERKIGFIKMLYKKVDKEISKAINDKIKSKKIGQTDELSSSEIDAVIAAVVSKLATKICAAIVPSATATGAAAGAATGAAAGSAVPGAGTAAGAATGAASGGSSGAAGGSVLAVMCKPVVTMVMIYASGVIRNKIREAGTGSQVDTTGDPDPTTPNIPPVDDEGTDSNMLLYGGAALAAILLLRK